VHHARGSCSLVGSLFKVPLARVNDPYIMSLFSEYLARGSGAAYLDTTLMTLYKLIKFLSPLKIERTPHDVRANLVYVLICGYPTRLEHRPSLGPAVSGLCYRGSISTS